MRILPMLLTVGLAVSCRSETGVGRTAADPNSTVERTTAESAKATVDDERAANLATYRFVYLPAAQRLVAEHRGRWIAIAGGRVVPAAGAEPTPVATMDIAAAAAAAIAPNARHRFVFQVGEDGDVEWPLGGCELPHVMGTYFLELVDREDVRLNLSPKQPSMLFIQGDRTQELAIKGADTRLYVQPEVGPPGAPGVVGATYCLGTGFGGFVTMSPSSAAGLELWEIPGKARVEGPLQSGDCRRARARFRWQNTPLDFTVPVAIWPK